MVQALVALSIWLNVLAGGNCYGITHAHAVTQSVRPGVITYFTVNYNGLYDRIATVRKPSNLTRIWFNGIVCYGQLDVVKWGYE